MSDERELTTDEKDATTSTEESSLADGQDPTSNEESAATSTEEASFAYSEPAMDEGSYIMSNEDELFGTDRKTTPRSYNPKATAVPETQPCATMSKVSLVMGIVALIGLFILDYLTIICGFIGMGLSLYAMYKGNTSRINTAGLVTSMVAIFVLVIMYVIVIVLTV